VPVFDIVTADELLAQSTGPRRFRLFLLGGFAATALVLACIGLFGVMAYLVSQRVHEIGLRLALGAQRADVFRLVVGRGLLLASGGAVAGVALALSVAPSLRSMLFGVDPFDAPTFIGAPALLVAVSLIACYVPARRAMRVDPLVALRDQ
jgi:putative ABC transport system permease protein